MITPTQTVISTCTSIFCIASGFLVDIKDELSAISVVVGIMVGLTVIALNLKRLFSKPKK